MAADPLRCVLAAVALTALLAPASSAQETVSGMEAGGLATGLTLDGELRYVTSPGFGVRVDFNVTPRVAIEARGAFYPANEVARFRSQGGQTWQVAVGGRAKFVRSQRWSLYGLLLPGVIRFSNAITDFKGESATTGASTHFALGLGGGVEFYPRTRWVVHLELQSLLYAYQGSDSKPGPALDGLVVSGPAYTGKIEDNGVFVAGIGYRFGALRPVRRELGVSERWEVIPQIGHHASRQASEQTSLYSGPGIGASISRVLSEHVHADGTFTAFLGEAPVSTPADGGRLMQALGGIKWGQRKDQFGMFLKVRTGISSYSRAIGSIIEQPSQLFQVTHRRATDVALDLGGVLEWYFGRRGVLRFDASHVRTYVSTTITLDGVIYDASGSVTDGIQTSLGVGWRF